MTRNHIEGQGWRRPEKDSYNSPTGFASALAMSMTALIPPILSALEPGGTVVAA
jgi:hypothetical protein